MSTAKLATPSRLEKARNRLENAVGKIETALDERAKAESDAGATADRALADVQSEKMALQDAGDRLARQLDDVIGRLKAVLEG